MKRYRDMRYEEQEEFAKNIFLGVFVAVIWLAVFILLAIRLAE